jgi:hypothetical protein
VIKVREASIPFLLRAVLFAESNKQNALGDAISAIRIKILM